MKLNPTRFFIGTCWLFLLDFTDLLVGDTTYMVVCSSLRAILKLVI